MTYARYVEDLVQFSQLSYWYGHPHAFAHQDNAYLDIARQTRNFLRKAEFNVMPWSSRCWV